jgi:acetolactate synthase-1/2/3 large subunit
MATRLLDSQVSVPEAIARVLEQAGIEFVFGMPGGRTGAIYQALYDHRSTIRCVLVREEGLAAVMADVYGRLRGRPGVCMGQGAFMLTNGGMGLVEAYLAGSPVLVLSDLSDGSPFSHHGPYQAGTGDYGTWDARGSCPCRLRINLPGSPVTCHRDKKAWTRELSWAPSGPLTPGDTRAACRVDAPYQLRPLPVAASHSGLLTALRAAARAARGRAAPRAASTHDPSVPPPWPVSAAATAWSSPGRWWAQAEATAPVSWHGAGKSYSTRDTIPVAGVSPLHLCTASSRGVPRRRHAGGSSGSPAQ